MTELGLSDTLVRHQDKILHVKKGVKKNVSALYGFWGLLIHPQTKSPRGFTVRSVEVGESGGTQEIKGRYEGSATCTVQSVLTNFP